MYLKSFLNRIIMLIQLILVVIFIVFEEIIWEGIAKPIYDYVYELHILQVLQKRIESTNRYIVLIIFIIMLTGVEGAGLLAGAMALRGMVITAALLYGFKIPIAAFTFWFFHAAEPKLLSFGWFSWAYEQTVSIFAWIKERDIYKSAKKMFRETKEYIRKLKAYYFSGKNTILKRFKRLYEMLKKLLKKGRDPL